jgi:ribosome maturation factor RimP
MMDVAAHVEGLLRDVVELDGVELVYVEYQPEGSPSVLRIYIDKLGGVGLKDCERVSKQASALLDDETFTLSRFVLEVSSPGIERPLFKEADYRRFVGKEIRLFTTETIEDRRKFTGLIRTFSEGILKLDFDGETYQIPFSKIRKANLVHQFK